MYYYAHNPCAACKTQRRKCTRDCVFAPLLPPDQTDKFVTLHRVFGASNVAKLLKQLPPSERPDAVNSLHWEAQCRLADPIYGCVGNIALLQKNLKHIQGDLESARHELSQYMGDGAYLPMTTNPALVYPGMVLPQDVTGAYTLICDGANQAYLRKPQGQAVQRGMFPMTRQPLVIGEPQPQQQQVYEAQPLSAVPAAQQLLPLQQQQEVYEAQPLSAIPAMQQQQLSDYSTDGQGLQMLLRLYGQGQQEQLQQQELMMFNSGNAAHHGYLNQFPAGGGDGSGPSDMTSTGLSLGNYDQAYHMQQQQAEHQHPQPLGINLNQQQQLGDDLGLNFNQQQQLGDDLGLNLNDQQQLGDDLGLNLNQQQQLDDELGLNLNHQQQDIDARLAGVRMFLGRLGPPK